MNQSKAVLLRFLKGALASGLASMALVTIEQPKVWTDFGPLLSSLGIAGLFGAISGLILAIEKWATWTKVPPTE